MYMININLEGLAGGLTLEQEKELLLKEAQIALGKLEVRKLELENLGIDDLITETELTRIEDEIKKHEKLVADLGGTIETK